MLYFWDQPKLSVCCRRQLKRQQLNQRYSAMKTSTRVVDVQNVKLSNTFSWYHYSEIFTKTFDLIYVLHLRHVCVRLLFQYLYLMISLISVDEKQVTTVQKLFEFSPHVITEVAQFSDNISVTNGI